MRVRAAVLTKAFAVRAVCTLAYAAGVWLRWLYVLRLHHPRNAIFGDSMPITELAEILVDPAGVQKCFHTVWPPGASAHLALHLVFDPTLGSAAVALLVLSCALPLFIADAARRIYGARAGWLALALASLDLVFVHYSAYFLSEALFLFAVTLAVWASTLALVAGEQSEERGARRTRAWARWTVVAGLVAGAAWGLAFAFRSNALPVAVFAGLVLGGRWLRGRRYVALAGLAGGLLGLLVVAAPIADRCTLLTGHPCLGANNFAMNVALGQAPDVAGLHFIPQPHSQCADGMNFWFPPARVRRGYQGVGDVPTSIYDTRGVLAWTARRVAAAPLDALSKAVGNSLDLLGTDYWPDDFAWISKRQATVLAQVYLVAVLFPGIAMGAVVLRRGIRTRKVSDPELLLLAVGVAVFLVSALSMGESRYRAPFDMVFIVLAARAFAGPPLAPREEPSRPLPRPLAVAGVGLIVVAALLGGAAHPGLRLAARLAAHVHPRTPIPARLGTRALADFAFRRGDGTPWDAPGNVRFRCSPDCSPITIDLGGVVHSAAVEISTDGNDRYELGFHRGVSEVGRLAWGVFEGPMGMRVMHLAVPPSAVDQGYDTLTLRPLYGDGSYSVGHVLLSNP